MVKHQPLQVYERQLCLSCLTGIYGCRWKRYQRSHDNSTKWECLWFIILFLTFILLLCWAFFWWSARNDYSEFNWLLYNRSGDWTDSTVAIVTTTAASFTYVAFLMILALCHIAVGQQLNLFWLHKTLVTAALLSTIAGLIYINRLWGDEWNTIVISLQSMGPFLHIGALAAITMLAWLVAGQVIHVERTSKCACTSFTLLLLGYLGAILCLYLAPLAITAPCLMDSDHLSPRPAVIGRRGAPTLAPENTFLSFTKALQQKVSGLEADVTISLDGVPFLMRDHSLRRTTDVDRLFPKRQFDGASSFSWAELSTLNAGQWFLRDDPFWIVQYMTPKERAQVANQSVCRLEEMLQLAVESNCSVLFHLRRPPLGHPRHVSWVNDTLQVVLRSGTPQKRVMWTPDWDREVVRQVASGFQQTSEEKLSTEALQDQGILQVYLRYNQVTRSDLREFSANNLSVTLYTVNEPWLYSALWCSGVSSVSSDAPHVLRNVPYPVWLMSPGEYCLIWILSDLISFAIIIGIFIFQKWRMSGVRSYNPEQIMLSAAVRRSSQDVSLMKEKLIFSGIYEDRLSFCTSHQGDLLLWSHALIVDGSHCEYLVK
uniref:Glycerophosphodiester phosphodiesterase domain containing 5 n=1 Tax=Scleropages formosus TaxID=113540 RepID=A0A8C9SL97_SCLFO